MKLKPSPVQLREPASADLRSFMLECFSDDRMRLRPPANPVLFDNDVWSVVLFREGQTQVELIIVAPNVEIPSHCHDDVDSYEVAMSCGMEFFIEGTQAGYFREPRSDGQSRDVGKFVPIPGDAFHNGRSGPKGACFLSVQRWRDGVTPTHVGLNWRAG